MIGHDHETVKLATTTTSHVSVVAIAAKCLRLMHITFLGGVGVLPTAFANFWATARLLLLLFP